MFKTESIILKIESIRDNQTRVVLLTREYGKVSCWYRKRQFLHDIGDMIFVVLERDNSTNTIKFTENMYSPRESHWNYSKIRVFLESLALMNTLIPEMAPYASLFHDYRGLLTHMQKSESLHEHHYLLFQFRILRTLGYIGSENFSSSPVPSYIFENILRTPLGSLLQSKVLKEEDANIIQRANHEAIYRSTQ